MQLFVKWTMFFFPCRIVAPFGSIVRRGCFTTASEDPRSPDVAMLLDDVWRRANRFPVYRDSLIGALRILAPHGIGGSRAARLLHLAWRDVVYKARFGGIDRTPDEIERLMELFPEPDEYN